MVEEDFSKKLSASKKWNLMVLIACVNSIPAIVLFMNYEKLLYLYTDSIYSMQLKNIFLFYTIL